MFQISPSTWPEKEFSPGFSPSHLRHDADLFGFLAAPLDFIDGLGDGIKESLSHGRHTHSDSHYGAMLIAHCRRSATL